MNYLAHCCLVPPKPEYWAGSVMADVIHGPDLSALPEGFAKAVRFHRWVDQWTDAHPENKAARALFLPPFRRYAGIIIDITYDHFLAAHFDAIEGRNLDEFAEDIYASLATFEHLIPAAKRARIQYISRTRLLHAYQDFSGVERALNGLATRFSRPTPLADAPALVKTLLPQLNSHFDVFYPALKKQAQRQWQSLN